MADETTPIGMMRAQLAESSFTQRWGPTQLEPATAQNPYGHRGVDFVLPGGTRANVRSLLSGIVTQVDRDPGRGYGYSVKLLAPNGYSLRVGHLSQNPTLRVGDRVYAGDVLGYQGDTGWSTGTHVHYELTDPQNRPLDPVGPLAPNNPAAWKRLWWTAAHGMGFGGGWTDNQVFAAPEPTGPLPSGATAYSTAAWFTTATQRLYPQVSRSGDPNYDPNAEPAPTPGSGTTSPCTWDNNPLTLPAYVACVTGQAVTQTTSGITGIFSQGIFGLLTQPLTTTQQWVRNNFVPTAFVFGTGLVLAIVGLRYLRQEAPIQILQPAGQAADIATGGPLRRASKAASRKVGSVVVGAANTNTEYNLPVEVPPSGVGVGFSPERISAASAARIIAR